MSIPLHVFDLLIPVALSIGAVCGRRGVHPPPKYSLHTL